MKISQRALSLTTSPIRKLGPYAQDAVKAGKKVYHLNIGQPDIETPPQFMDAIRNYNKKVIAYGPSQGDAKLISQIQKYYKEWDMYYGQDLEGAIFHFKNAPIIKAIPREKANFIIRKRDEDSFWVIHQE